MTVRILNSSTKRRGTFPIPQSFPLFTKERTSGGEEMFFYSSPISKCRVLGELNQEVQWKEERRREKEESFFSLVPFF